MPLYQEQTYQLQRDDDTSPGTRPALVRYGFAAVCVLAAWAISSVLGPILGDRISFLFFMAASLIAARTSGLGPGLAALGAGFVVADFLLPPHGLRLPHMADLAMMLIHACIGGIGLAAIAGFHRARAREQRLRHLTGQLEREVAKRSYAEVALESHMERMDFALQAARMWTWNLSIPDCVFEWSPHHELILGARRGTSPGTGEEFLAYVHPQDRNRLRATLTRSIEKRVDYEQDFRIIWTDGSRHWVLAKGRFLRDEQDVARRVSGIMMEITGRREAEEALRRSEAQLHELADAMPQIVWTARPDGQVDYVNKKWLEYSGLPAEKAYSHEGWKLVTHPEDEPRAMEAIQKTLRTGEPLQIETRIKHCDDGYRWHLSRAVSVRDETGHIVRWFATTTDIEDQKRTEQDLQQAKEQLATYVHSLEGQVARRTAKLEETIRSLEGILYHVAHDLRAPLRTMTGFTQVLMESTGPQVDAEGRDAAVRIIDAARRMDQLILDLLAYGRLGHVRVMPGRVSLEELIRVVLNRMVRSIEATQAAVEVTRPLHEVCADPSILKLALGNILKNALTFVGSGVTPRIHIWSEARSAKVRLWIADNGIGIEPEYRERIFRVFERLHRSDEYSGTGIGLAIVAKGMERMGGTVGVESKVGEGSRFWLELPVDGGKA
jgi:PAS domain S-box-containing protein